jgi:hypothetical protein
MANSPKRQITKKEALKDFLSLLHCCHMKKREGGESETWVVCSGGVAMIIMACKSHKTSKPVMS